MVDIVSAETRSRMMSNIRARNTSPELQVRRALHAAKLRFRLHRKDLPGRPDIVLARWNVVIFVNGCFWHWHDCSAGRIPDTRREFWIAKLSANRKRDNIKKNELLSSGWRVLTVWECALKGRARNPLFASEAVDFIKSNSSAADITGRPF